MNQAAADGGPHSFCFRPLLPYFCRYAIRKIQDDGPLRSRPRDMELNSIEQPCTPKTCPWPQEAFPRESGSATLAPSWHSRESGKDIFKVQER